MDFSSVAKMFYRRELHTRFAITNKITCLLLIYIAMSLCVIALDQKKVHGCKLTERSPSAISYDPRHCLTQHTHTHTHTELVSRESFNSAWPNYIEKSFNII